MLLSFWRVFFQNACNINVIQLYIRTIIISTHDVKMREYSEINVFESTCMVFYYVFMLVMLIYTNQLATRLELLV